RSPGPSPLRLEASPSTTTCCDLRQETISSRPRNASLPTSPGLPRRTRRVLHPAGSITTWSAPGTAVRLERERWDRIRLALREPGAGAHDGGGDEGRSGPAAGADYLSWGQLEGSAASHCFRLSTIFFVPMVGR